MSNGNEYMVSVRCPYCDVRNSYVMREEIRRIVGCHNSGGCDRQFVLQIELEIHSLTYKIEGEEHEQ
jgi:hypothetical protein